jgi:hypothetical protein
MGAVKPRLDMQAVKTRAACVPGCELVANSNGNVCSFVVGVQTTSTGSISVSSPSAKDMARVHIFTDTGTVAVGRIVQGKYRQVFRRNVSSLDVVEELLRSPPPLTVIDETLLGTTSAPKSVLGQLELVEIGSAILEGTSLAQGGSCRRSDPLRPRLTRMSFAWCGDRRTGTFGQSFG